MSIYGHLLESNVGINYSQFELSFTNENTEFLSILESVDDELLFETGFRLDIGKIKSAIQKLIEAFKKWAKDIYEKLTAIIGKIKDKFSKKSLGDLDDKEVKGLQVNSNRTGKINVYEDGFKTVNKMLDGFQSMHEDLVGLANDIYHQVEKFDTHDIETNSKVFHNWCNFDASTKYNWMMGLSVHITDDFKVKLKDADNFVNNIKVGNKDLDEANTILKSNTTHIDSIVSDIAKLSIKQMDTEDPTRGIDTPAGYTTVLDCIRATDRALNAITGSYMSFHSRYTTLIGTLVSYYVYILGEVSAPTL